MSRFGIDRDTAHMVTNYLTAQDIRPLPDDPGSENYCNDLFASVLWSIRWESMQEDGLLHRSMSICLETGNRNNLYAIVEMAKKCAADWEPHIRQIESIECPDLRLVESAESAKAHLAPIYKFLAWAQEPAPTTQLSLF